MHTGRYTESMITESTTRFPPSARIPVRKPKENEHFLPRERCASAHPRLCCCGNTEKLTFPTKFPKTIGKSTFSASTVVRNTIVCPAPTSGTTKIKLYLVAVCFAVWIYQRVARRTSASRHNHPYRDRHPTVNQNKNQAFILSDKRRPPDCSPCHMCPVFPCLRITIPRKEW